MADDPALEEKVQTIVVRPSFRRRLRFMAMRGLGVVLLLFGVAVVVLNSPIGHRLVTDQIAKMSPASGMQIRIGRIDGNLFGKAVLRDVTVADPKGDFLQIPQVDLDWRPFHWFTSGLDIRNLVTHRGTLLRRPQLLKSNPNSPTLPNFDIRLDRFRIDNLTVAPGIAGAEAQRINLLARADVKQGRVYLKADGKLGNVDRLHALIDAEPDGDRFDLDLDYLAAKDGVVAGLIGSKSGYHARLFGKGTWKQWQGRGLVTRDGKQFVAFRLRNDGGQYAISGNAQPGDALSGVAARLAGKTVTYSGAGTLVNSVLDGRLQVVGGGMRGSAKGAIDLGNNAAKDLAVDLRLTDPAAFGAGSKVEGALLSAMLDGPFRKLAVEHRLQVAQIVSGSTRIEGILQQATIRYDGKRWLVPLDARIARVITGTQQVDSRLVSGTLRGDATLAGGKISSDRLALDFHGATARLAFAGDLAKSTYRFTGPVTANGIELASVGKANAQAAIDLAIGGKAAWSLSANLTARVPQVANPTVASLAGPDIRLASGVSLAAGAPLRVNRLKLDAAKLTLTAAGAYGQGKTTLKGQGRSSDYSKFTIDGAYSDRGPDAVLVFANPVPAAGLRDVRVALTPIEGGLGIETKGGSTLGPFAGSMALSAPASGPTTLAIKHLDVWKTAITGDLALAGGGADGTLALKGGGLDGTIGLQPRDGGQDFTVDLKVRDAVFGGLTPMSVARATVKGTGSLANGTSRIDGSVFAMGISYGRMFVGRFAAKAKLAGGIGTINASIAGRRGSRFGLQLAAEAAPGRYTVAANGSYRDGAIAMPRRAVIEKRPGGGWQLQPTQLNYGGGSMIAEGSFGTGAASAHLQLADMPLTLTDIASDALDLGGSISGVVDLAREPDGVPTGEAKVQVKGLTRSGLLLTSRPIDLALVMKLDRDRIATRAVVDSADGKRLGRLQGRIASLPASGTLFDRLRAGDLFAQLRYAGPADALWRLVAVNTFDLTGPVSAAADVTGTLDNPQVRGSISSDDLRLRSGLTGTDLTKVKGRGTFDGSQLRLTSFSGTAPNGGTVLGSGTVGLSGMSSTRGPQLDLRLAAHNAALLDSSGLTAAVTGPMRIVSSGVGGMVAGRLQIDRASWKLGTAADVTQLPQIKTREVNRPADAAPQRAPSVPWRYLVDAKSDDGIDVRGMGLDSEWSANIRLRGTTADPRIGGTASAVRGTYTFASTQFDLTRGRITFDENTSIDPRLDIEATTTKNSLEVTAKVQGSALRSRITFTSNPSLPEEEILSRLLFGDSITQLSATDVLQLGAAVASLHGGGGLDPINQLRSAIGLDRLRIVSADPTIGRGTGIAVGKNIGRRAYIEIVTDGRGYSATDTEFRITSWLSLLGSVSTIGRSSIVAQASKDY
ncbi:translocation/assembly module TamB domain-containing protein [Tsuneonella mangrovi]|uniref:translocation/assembly module TamB domain-containing protein n=1 Tax=Tsuneonella mangrovi TaxID=1982042 RepID=UPI000BA23F54|nr:translocation/assembly module TamB domain-containing protein [Tsuneonella mangrovi]